MRGRSHILCPAVSGALQPVYILFQGDDVPVAFLFHLSGLLAPGVEIGVGDASGLNPREAALVLLTVGLEHRVVGLLLRPLLEGPRLPAGLLSLGNRALAVLRADPSRLGEPAPAVLAAPDKNRSLTALLNRFSGSLLKILVIRHSRQQIQQTILKLN